MRGVEDQVCTVHARPDHEACQDGFEELGTKIEVCNPPCFSSVRSRGKHTGLVAFRVELIGGKPEAPDCADFAWVSARGLERLDWTKADRPVLSALKRKA